MGRPWARRPEVQELYLDFQEAVVAHCDSIEAWLHEHRLQWPKQPTDAWPYLRAAMPSALFRVTPNDFPADTPTDVSRLLLQSRVPILDRSLAADQAEWRDVEERGVLFLSGMPEHAQAGIGLSVASELRKLVISLWPENHFETIVWVRSTRCGRADAADQSNRAAVGQGDCACARPGAAQDVRILAVNGWADLCYVG